MIIARDNVPGTSSCSCKERLRPATSRPDSAIVPEMPSLDSISTSLASGEVARLRSLLNRDSGWLNLEVAEQGTSRSQQRGRQNSDQSELRSSEISLLSKLKRIKQAISSSVHDTLMSSRVVSSARSGAELALDCVGRLCKVVALQLRAIANPSWAALVTLATSDAPLGGIGRCVNAFRSWFAESVLLPKVPIKTYEINAQAEVASRNPAIPRVVLAHRNESHRTEGRRRSRGFLRRRELVVADDENYGLEDEPIQPATRPDESSIVDQAPEQKRTVRVCRKIREIDAQYGTTPNNPRVAEVMAQLGTHYDSIERALETVLSLQLEELLEEQRGQAEELSRHNDWLKGELHSPEIVKRQKARSSDEGLSGDVCPQRRR